jgi:large subunit ribosomal protein L34
LFYLFLSARPNTCSPSTHSVSGGAQTPMLRRVALSLPSPFASARCLTTFPGIHTPSSPPPSALSFAAHCADSQDRSLAQPLDPSNAVAATLVHSHSLEHLSNFWRHVLNDRAVCPSPHVAQELECSKMTYQPKIKRRKRRHGFLSRLKTAGGRRTLIRRSIKGRHRLAPPG